MDETRRHHLFKDSTINLLSKKEKLEIIRAVDRASERLIKLADCDVSLPRRLAYIDRAILLMKGSMLPRQLYRRERQSEIWEHAFAISEVTGKPASEIHDCLMELMEPYVSEDL